MNTVALKQRWTNALSALAPSRNRTPEAEDSPPPFGQLVSVLDGAWRRQRALNLVLLLGLGSLNAYQGALIWGLSDDLRTQDYLVIPGAVDFSRVRPNMIPDSAVIDFAEYFTDRLVTVTARTMERRYGEMSRFMSPALGARIEAELAEALPLLRSLQGAEVWSQQGEPQVKRAEVDGFVVFEATIRGRVERFAGGRVIGTKEEVVLLTFRTSPLAGDSPWLFEVIDFERLTPEQHQKIVAGGAK